MKLFKRINCFFDRINHDVRLFNAKKGLLFGVITLCAGIFSWLIGGRPDRITLLYSFPRCAIPIGFMYVLWALSFALFGVFLGGIIYGCEKYKRREVWKIVVFLTISYLFTLCMYPLFFRCISPFIAFLFMLIAQMFCMLAILASCRIYSLWTLCLGIHLLWLMYNGYVLLIFSLIN